MAHFLKAYAALHHGEKNALDRALKGGAGRRDLLRVLAAMGITGAFATGVAGGASQARAQTPKKGGRIRIVGYASSTADTLDPAKAILNVDYLRIHSIYDALIRLDETLTPRMELAEEVATVDGKTWTVKLRKGVTFHDGSAFTADDVVFTLKRHTDPAVGSTAKALVAQFDTVEKTGSHEVRIVLKAPNADLPTILGTPAFQMVKNGTTDFSKGIGTGPFVITEFKPGERSICVANRNYWRGSEGPFLDEFELFAIQDASARVNALVAGDVDVIANVDPRSASLVEGAGHHLLRTVAGQYTNLIMRVDTDPGRNPEFVKAMKHLLDREKIKQAVFRGFAEVANDQPIPPTNRYHNAALAPPTFDPDLAKSLLNKAGLLGTKIPVVASSAAEQSVEIAVLLQQAARNIGLDLDIRRVAPDGYWTNYWLKAPICFGSINPRPSADVSFSLFYESGSSINESHWKDKRFDNILLEARGITDDAKRKDMYGELQTIAAADSGVAIPAFITGIDAYNARVKGFKPMPTGNLMGNAFTRSVWVD